MRSADPSAAAARVRRRRPRPARHHGRCPGAVREDLRRHRRGRHPGRRPRRGRRHRPQLRPGTPRELSIEEGTALARLARSSASAGSAGAADRRSSPRTCPPTTCGAIVAAVDPDAIQLSGDEPAVRARGSSDAPAWKALQGATGRRPGRGRRARARAYLDAGAERILLDTAGGPHPGGTGVRVEAGIAAAVARQVPVTLAGGLNPPTSPRRCWRIPASGVDVASGTDAPRVTGERPRKDPFRVALFTKRARDARRHRPNVAFGPTPVARRPARGRRRRPVGHGARLRRAVRPRDAGRGARAARGRVRRRPPRPAVLGRARRPARPLRRPPDRRSTARTGSPQARRVEARRLAARRPGTGSAATPSRPSGCTSSARTSPTRVPTRSTTRSARRC